MTAMEREPKPRSTRLRRFIYTDNQSLALNERAMVINSGGR
jgi:hypothetical protein